MSLFGILLFVVYIGGAWKFWTGFRRTNYNQSRLMFTILWPVMLISKSYRQNFVKALKG